MDWRELPKGRTLAFVCLALAVGPLLVRGVLFISTGALEGLLFGISNGGSGHHLGLFPGEVASRLSDGVAGMTENLFLLAVSWAQPAQVVVRLMGMESRWINPITALLALTMLIWPLGSAIVALVRDQLHSRAARILLLLLSGAAGIATVVPPGGPMVIVAIVLLAPFILASRNVIAQSGAESWLPDLLSFAYVLALVVDVGVGWWVVS